MGFGMRARYLGIAVAGLMILSGCTLQLSLPEPPSETPPPTASISAAPVEAGTGEPIPVSSVTADKVTVMPSPKVDACPGNIELPVDIDPRACGPVPEDAINGNRGERFITPSGNIACTMGEEDVMCEALETAMIKDFDNPEGDGQCNGFWLGFSASYLCHSGIAIWGEESDPSDWPVLAYGDSVFVFQYICASEDNGVTCWNGETGHGFLLSRSRYTHW